MPSVAVLFARADSIYKTLPSCDVFDLARDARNYCGELPVVAHPPCRAWGRLRTFAKPRPDEKALVFFAIDNVRRCGGVLEHPASSSLWTTSGLPLPGQGFDDFGGWSLEVPQKRWGHLAEKNTWLYICGVRPSELPAIPLILGDASHVVASSKKTGGRPELPRYMREATPLAFATWLVDLAKKASYIPHPLEH